LIAGHSASSRATTASNGSSIEPVDARSYRGGATAVANRRTVRRLIPNRAAISRRETPSAAIALTCAHSTALHTPFAASPSSPPDDLEAPDGTVDTGPSSGARFNS
jgi:hypothetical protein